MLNDDQRRPVLSCNYHCCPPPDGLSWRRRETCLAVMMSWKERKAKGSKQPMQNSSAIMFSLTLSVSLPTRALRCVEGASPYHPQSLSVWSFAFSHWLWCPTEEDHSPLPLLTSPPYRDGMIDSWEKKGRGFWDSVCMLWELEGLSLLKVVEVLPRYFIFIVKYSTRMVDRGNFCSQPTIQKWKGCGLWMKGAREIDTHGASW